MTRFILLLGLLALVQQRDTAVTPGTGEIAGVPSMRDGKVVRVGQWLARRGWDWADVETTFYSDSMNDLPLLRAVDAPVAVGPDARLAAIARERGWPVLHLT